MKYTTIELPTYANEALAGYTATELIESIIRDEDRVPRNVIDECVRRGAPMLDALSPYAQADDQQESDNPGRWWLRLHAVMILGLIPDERAGQLLVEFVHGMCREQDEDLQDWLSGYWPAFMRNKPASVIDPLRAFCADENIDWFMRTNITEAVIAYAKYQGEAELEQTLDWAAQLVTDEEEDWDFRLSTASNLLDYPRERHHALIMELAARQSGLGAWFNKGDVDKAYARKCNAPEKEGFNNPWSFYEPKKIESRQKRWQEEFLLDKDLNTDFEDFPNSGFGYQYHETYQRDTPKIGRNDPCPCGSGKKYKKCCLGKESS